MHLYSFLAELESNYQIVLNSFSLTFFSSFKSNGLRPCPPESSTPQAPPALVQHGRRPGGGLAYNNNNKPIAKRVDPTDLQQARPKRLQQQQQRDARLALTTTTQSRRSVQITAAPTSSAWSAAPSGESQKPPENSS